MSSRGIPEVLMKKVDEYVDSLAPQVQPRITSELEDFQAKTIDSLEDQVIDAFRSLFNKDSRDGGSSRGVRSGSAPDAYGGQSLPFANEISKLTRSFTDIADEASGDLSDILKLTQGDDGPGDTRSRGGGGSNGSDSSRGMKGFLSTAVNAVQDHLDSKATGPGGQNFELEGLLGILSNTVQDAARNPEDKARLISPEIKERVGAKLREQHAPIAEQFTRIALDHIKKWLRGNVTTRDLGDGAKGELEDQVKGLIKGVGSLFKEVTKQGDSSGSSRGVGDGDRDGDEGESKGFSKLISDKLSTGLGKVHREVRLEFRKVLGGLEKQLFELLPDEFQRPLEKILGGNPFDAQLDRDASPRGDRGFGDDIKAKLVGKLRDLVRKVQETLRESVLGVVSGGHRKFEKHSWVFVQNIVEGKVQKYLPKVKITVPDDIGDEGVDVGAPAPGTQLGGGSKPVSSPQGGRVSPPPQEQHGRPPYGQDQHQDSRPSHHQQQSQDYRPDNYQQGQSQQDYRPGSHQQHQSQQDDYQPGLQQHHSQKDDYRPGHQQQQQSQSQDYRPGHQQHQSQDYRPDNYQQTQSQGHRPDQHQSQHGYRPDSYQQGQSQQDYRPDPYQRHESSQDSRPSQYQSQPQDSSRQDRFDEPQGYQQGHRQDSRQDYQQDQGEYRRDSREDYRQDSGYQREQSYGQGSQQDYRQEQASYRQNESYEQGQRYGQNSRY